MHAALLTNTAWLDEALPMLQHMTVGFLDEHVRVTQVVPDSAAMDEVPLFGQRVVWKESPVRWWNQFRLARVASQLEELDINLIHALDGRLWAGGVRLAEKMNLPLILRSGSYLDVDLLGKLRRRLVPARTAIHAGTEPLANALREQAPEGVSVHLIRSGVHVSGEPPKLMEDDQVLCVTVTGNGQLDHWYRQLMEGIARIVAQYPHAQFFFDGQDIEQHAIWKLAEQLSLLGNVSLIPRRLGHRELLMRSHVLVHPQPLGRTRTVVLHAMANAVPIIAQQDPWLDYLIDNETAWLVDHPTPSQWVEMLQRIFESPDELRELGLRARQWVARHRLASHMVEQMLHLYRVTSGEALQFPATQ